MIRSLLQQRPDLVPPLLLRRRRTPRRQLALTRRRRARVGELRIGRRCRGLQRQELAMGRLLGAR
jgi:hypothetical protein